MWEAWTIDPNRQTVTKMEFVTLDTDGSGGSAVSARVAGETSVESVEVALSEIDGSIKDLETRLTALTARRCGVEADVLCAVAGWLDDSANPSNVRAHCLGSARSGTYIWLFGIWCARPACVCRRVCRDRTDERPCAGEGWSPPSR